MRLSTTSPRRPSPVQFRSRGGDSPLIASRPVTRELSSPFSVCFNESSMAPTFNRAERFSGFVPVRLDEDARARAAEKKRVKIRMMIEKDEQEDLESVRQLSAFSCTPRRFELAEPQTGMVRRRRRKGKNTVIVPTPGRRSPLKARAFSTSPCSAAGSEDTGKSGGGDESLWSSRERKTRRMVGTYNSSSSSSSSSKSTRSKGKINDKRRNTGGKNKTMKTTGKFGKRPGDSQPSPRSQVVSPLLVSSSDVFTSRLMPNSSSFTSSWSSSASSTPRRTHSITPLQIHRRKTQEAIDKRLKPFWYVLHFSLHDSAVC